MDYKNYNPRAAALAQARTLLTDAVKAAVADGTLPEAALPDFIVEIPADVKNGDIASNVAMAGARAFHKAPRQIAEAITAKLQLDGSLFDRFEVAGPGFINLFLGQDWFTSVVRAAVANPEYGRTDAGAGKKYNVEFVSANPTGPMHMGNARGGALGDGLAACLDWAGYDVTREFYINDAGNQIEKFGKSLAIRYLQLYKGEDACPLPEECYQGADIIARAKEFAEVHGDSYVEKDFDELKKAIVADALPKNIAGLQRDLGKYRIEYDVWFHESDLHNSGAVKAVVDKLLETGACYKAEDGAIMYRSAQYAAKYGVVNKRKTDDGSEEEAKDEVLVRANGIPTYFAADIAYHYNKLAVRGFDKAIDVWGADHHGHVARMKGAMDAIGLDGSRLDIVLMQMVNLMRDGKPVMQPVVGGILKNRERVGDRQHAPAAGAGRREAPGDGGIAQSIGAFGIALRPFLVIGLKLHQRGRKADMQPDEVTRRRELLQLGKCSIDFRARRHDDLDRLRFLYVIWKMAQIAVVSSDSVHPHVLFRLP